MSGSVCYIVGAGERTEDVLTPRPGDLVLAADGGYLWLTEMGIEPDQIVGDFDSLLEIPNRPGVVCLAKEKDETDTMAAVRLAVEQGCREFHIYGGTGGRFDHTVANLQLLTWLSRRKYVNRLYGKNWIAAAVTNGALCFPPSARGMLSVFCKGDTARNVCLEGLKYPLVHATLTCDVALGVSNEWIGQPSRVAVGEGTLLVIWERQESR